MSTPSTTPSSGPEVSSAKKSQFTDDELRQAIAETVPKPYADQLIEKLLSKESGSRGQGSDP